MAGEPRRVLEMSKAQSERGLSNIFSKVFHSYLHIREVKDYVTIRLPCLGL